MKKLVSGVNHGCTACCYSPTEYNDPEVINAGTELNRSFSSNMEVSFLNNSTQVFTDHGGLK